MTSSPTTDADFVYNFSTLVNGYAKSKMTSQSSTTSEGSDNGIDMVDCCADVPRFYPKTQFLSCLENILKDYVNPEKVKNILSNVKEDMKTHEHSL